MAACKLTRRHRSRLIGVLSAAQLGPTELFSPCKILQLVNLCFSSSFPHRLLQKHSARVFFNQIKTIRAASIFSRSRPLIPLTSPRPPELRLTLARLALVSRPYLNRLRWR